MPSAGVCDWVGYCLCIRDHPLAFKDKVSPKKITGTAQVFDAVIVWKDQPKRESSGGVAYDIILKDAIADSPRQASPPKPARQLSQEILQQKLKEAEERRLALEAEKLQICSTEKRILAAHQRINMEKENFSKEVKQKIEKKHETVEQNKTSRVQALQERLREHAKHVIEVKNAYEEVQEKKKEQLLQKIYEKQNEYTENREESLLNIKKKLEDHDKHCDQIIQSAKSFNKNTEEKILHKMEQTRINRETQLEELMEKLKSHDFKVQELKTKRKSMNLAPSDENDPPAQ